MRKQLKSMAVAIPLTIFLVTPSDLPDESERTGKITGVVLDQATHQPVVGATVVVEGTRFGTATNANGEYSIIGLPVGTYTIRASFVGFESVIHHDVKIEEGVALELDFALRRDPGAADEVVMEYEDLRLQKNETGLPMALESQIGHMLPAPARSDHDVRPEFNTEEYSLIVENGFKSPLKNPLSTFAIDVDAGSYSNIRRFITSGQEPPVDAIRIEEMINYFGYRYPEPENDQAFSVVTELGVAPWDPDHQLLHVGLQGKRLRSSERPASNLVFLLDVSGSMQPENKLPLLKRAFRMLVDEIGKNDRVAIVVYAGSSGLVLPSTSGDDKEAMLAAINRLEAGGSTAGAAGIRLAYQIADENFIEGGNNRVILATDGDFNVGVSSTSELIRMIEEKREQGTFLTVLGFGIGNLKDGRMEQIANHGNGNYYYIDNLQEARKVLVTEMQSTLFTIAKDVKIQIEFNPAFVESYRLIGYENRLLAPEDFDDDTKDAGELGAGHTVTALYEIIPASRKSISDTDESGDLRYQQSGLTADAFSSGELMTLSLRYKQPDGDKSSLISRRVGARLPESTSDDFLFSAAVAEFGMILRDSEYMADASLGQVLSMASVAQGEDRFGYRESFVEMVQQYAQIVGDEVSVVVD